MYEGSENQKRYRMARLHKMVLNARGRGIPGKLAEVGALCVAVGAGIWSAQHGRMIFGSAVVMFVLYSIILQILCRLVFLSISLITLPAYHLFIKHQSNAWRQTWGSEEFFFRNNRQNDEEETTYKNHSDSEQSQKSEQRRQYEQRSDSKSREHHATSNDSNMTKNEAMALFGLKEGFSIEELKKAHRDKIKKYHPDMMNGNQTAENEEMTKKINIAYDFLKSGAA